MRRRRDDWIAPWRETSAAGEHNGTTALLDRAELDEERGVIEHVVGSKHEHLMDPSMST